MATGRTLVIVESPAKASTIARLPRRRTTSSSPRSATSATCRSAPPRSRRQDKGRPWARLGVDVDNDFEPLYVVDADKKTQVAELKALLKDADELYLATDEDREGEAIAWHLLEVLQAQGAGPADGVPRDHPGGDPAGRSTNPRDLDDGPGRRPGDPPHPRPALRLRGLARCCGRRSCPGLSAGRVQSVATRLVVERERERMAFRAAGVLGPRGRLRPRPALVRARGSPPSTAARVATGKRLRPTTARSSADGVAASTRRARDGARRRRCAAAAFTVRSVDEKPYTRRPPRRS